MSGTAMDFTIRSLEEELSSFDRTVDDSRSKRDIAVDKAMKLLEKVDVATVSVSDPKEVAAVGAVIGTALKALDAADASAQRSVNAKLRHQEQKKTSAVSEQVVELFKRVQAGQIGASADPSIRVSLDDESAAITTDLVNNGITILNTELRSDPDDLAPDKT